MSKINSLRFVNINYNDNKIRISDDIMYLNGENTLFSLINGGGKTVIVQMVTALFIQKKYRDMKDRPFSGFFTSSRPSFIMAEWILDKGAGFVLTGMMVRQSQNPDTGNELEMINFISEYKEPCLHDLAHLPVTEKANGKITLKSFGTCRQLFEGFKKNPSIHFFCYDMNSDTLSKQYFDKLMEYGINYREWQAIIRKINYDESGLSDLFTDCKNEKKLVEKWFLESIEDKLNGRGNRIKEFRDIMGKCASNYWKNREKIKQRDTIQKFNTEAELISSTCDTYLLAEEEEDAALKKITSYIRELQRCQSLAARKIGEAKDQVSLLQSKLDLLAHQKYSAEFYKEQDKIDNLAKDIVHLLQKAEDINEKKSAWIRKGNILKLARLQEAVDSDRLALELAEAALEVCRREGENLEPERDYLGYRIRLSYDGKIKSLENEIKAAEAEAGREEKSRINASDGLKKLAEEIRETSREEGRLSEAVRSFHKDEERFSSRWKISLERNILGEYEPGMPGALGTQINASIAEASNRHAQEMKQLADTRAQSKDAERHIQDMEIRYRELSQEFVNAQDRKDALDRELDERRNILSYLEMGEEDIFDTGKILRESDRKLEELDASIRKLASEESAIMEEIERTTSGRMQEIPQDVCTMLEGLGIRIVQGMEWLKRNGLAEDDNMLLVESHPFLPYSLIMTEAEVKKLDAAQHIAFTPFPIPIVTRESLARDGSSNGNGMPKAGDTSFYILFNRNLLNEEKLIEIVRKLEEDLGKKRLEREQRKQEFNDYMARRVKAESHAVTANIYDEAARAIARLESQMNSAQMEISERKQSLNILREQEETLSKETRMLEKELDNLKLKLSDCQTFAQAYAQYLQAKNALAGCKERLDSAYKREDELRTQEAICIQRIDSLKETLTGLRSHLEKEQGEASAYQHFRESSRPSNVSEENVDNDSWLMSRFTAITERVSRQELALENDRRKADEKLKESEKEMERMSEKLALQPCDWAGIHYTIAAEDRAEEEIRQLSLQAGNTEAMLNEADKSRALAEQRQEQVVRQMSSECRTSDPLPREDVPDIDFASVKVTILNEKKETMDRLSILEKRERKLSVNITALSEFKVEAAPPEDSPCWEVNFMLMSEDELGSFTGNLKRTYRKCQENRSRAKENFISTLNRLRAMEEFQEDFYRKPLDSMLNAAHDPGFVKGMLQRTQAAYDNLMEKTSGELEIVMEEKRNIVMLLEEYIKNIHEQMGRIDENSKIPVRGKMVRMLEIGLPAWNVNAELCHARVDNLVSDLTEKCMALLDRNESIQNYLGKCLTVRELYDAVVGISNVQIHLYKIGAMQEQRITWSEVAKISGSEAFLSAFVVLSSLLYYMRQDDNDIFADRKEGNVLIMDNPFAKTYSSHILKPLMDLAEKNNTQLLCLSGLGSESIYECFDNIYTLNLVPSNLDSTQYLKASHKKGSDPYEISLSRIEVKETFEQMSLVF